jgi:hypothetical protein
MIEGPVENAAAAVAAIVRRGREWRAAIERDRRLRVIRNLHRNPHAWKGKRS